MSPARGPEGRWDAGAPASGGPVPGRVLGGPPLGIPRSVGRIRSRRGRGDRADRPPGERALAAGLAGVVAASTFAFGLVHGAPLLAAVLALAALGLPLALRAPPAPGWLVLPAALPLAAGTLQLVPLPGGIADALSPGRADLLARALGGVDLATGPLATVSAAPGETLRALAVPAAAALALLGLYAAARRSAERRSLEIALVASAVANAGLAFSQEALGARRIFWISSVPERADRFFGTFVCDNHWGSMAAMALALALGRAADALHRGSRLDRAEVGAAAAWGGAAAVLAAGMVASGSDGAVGMALGVSALVLLGHQVARGGAALAPTALALAAVGLALLAGPLTLWRGRLADSLADRLPVWRDALAMAADAGPLGMGIGTFSAVFPAWKRSPAWLHFDHAENSYVEVLATGGWVYAAALAAAGLLLARGLLRTWRGSTTRGRQAMVGPGVGLIALAVHSAFDFDLAIGALRLWGATLLVLAATAGRERSRRRSGPPLSEAEEGGEEEDPSPALPRVWPGRALGAAALALGVAGAGAMLAATPPREAQAAPGPAPTALSPWFGAFSSPAPHRAAAEEAMRRAREDIDGREPFLAAAEDHLTRAVALAPYDSATHVALGWCRTYRERFAEAEASLRTALDLFPTGPYEHLYLARFLRIARREGEAWGHFGTALRLWPSPRVGALWRELRGWSPTGEAWRAVFSAAGEARTVQLVRLMDDDRDAASSAVALPVALELHPLSSDLRWFRARALLASARREEAEAVLKELLEADPGHREAPATLGALLQDTGRPYEAIPLLRRALAEWPGREDVRWRLAEARLRTGDRGAEDVLAAMAEADPAGARAGELGAALRALGRCSDAVPWLRRASRVAPASPRWPAELASCHARIGRTEEGWKEIESWLAHAPPGGRDALRERLVAAGEPEMARRVGHGARGAAAGGPAR